MRRRAETAVRPSINVTPLVDVVLVLLIIFMVIAPTLAPDVVRLPKTERPTGRTDDGKKIEVVLGTKGEAWIDGRATTAERFADGIREAALGREEFHVEVKGDATLRFAEVEQALLAIEAAGFSGVDLIAEPRDKG